MKVMPWNKFANLPSGTIYSYYGPNSSGSYECEGLYRKGETVFPPNLRPSIFSEASFVPRCWKVDGPSLETTEISRLPDYDQLFAVFEEEDIKLLVGILQPNPK